MGALNWPFFRVKFLFYEDRNLDIGWLVQPIHNVLHMEIVRSERFHTDLIFQLNPLSNSGHKFSFVIVLAPSLVIHPKVLHADIVSRYSFTRIDNFSI